MHTHPINRARTVFPLTDLRDSTPPYRSQQTREAPPRAPYAMGPGGAYRVDGRIEAEYPVLASDVNKHGTVASGSPKTRDVMPTVLIPAAMPDLERSRRGPWNLRG